MRDRQDLQGESKNGGKIHLTLCGWCQKSAEKQIEPTGSAVPGNTIWTVISPREMNQQRGKLWHEITFLRGWERQNLSRNVRRRAGALQYSSGRVSRGVRAVGG